MIGKIKFINIDKRMGFITAEEEDFFFSFNQLLVLEPYLNTTVQYLNTTVQFDIRGEINKKKNRNREAIKIILADKNDFIDREIINTKYPAISNFYIKKILGDKIKLHVTEVEALVKKYASDRANALNPLFSENAQKNIIEKILQTHNVFLDTNILMNEYFPNILSNLIVPVLSKSGKKLLITIAVVNELQKLSDDAVLQTANKAKAANELISECLQDNIFAIPKKDGDASFADLDFISIFIKLRTKYNNCLITNDQDLQNDIIKNIQPLKSVHSNYKITILQIKNDKLIVVNENNRNTIHINENNYIEL